MLFLFKGGGFLSLNIHEVCATCLNSTHNERIPRVFTGAAGYHPAGTALPGKNGAEPPKCRQTEFVVSPWQLHAVGTVSLTLFSHIHHSLSPCY